MLFLTHFTSHTFHHLSNYRLDTLYSATSRLRWWWKKACCSSDGSKLLAPQWDPQVVHHLTLMGLLRSQPQISYQLLPIILSKMLMRAKFADGRLLIRGNHVCPCRRPRHPWSRLVKPPHSITHHQSVEKVQISMSPTTQTTEIMQETQDQKTPPPKSRQRESASPSHRAEMTHHLDEKNADVNTAKASRSSRKAT